MRFRTTCTHSPSDKHHIRVTYYTASSGAHALLHVAFDLLVTQFILNSNTTHTTHTAHTTHTTHTKHTQHTQHTHNTHTQHTQHTQHMLAKNGLAQNGLAKAGHDPRRPTPPWRPTPLLPLRPPPFETPSPSLPPDPLETPPETPPSPKKDWLRYVLQTEWLDYFKKM